MNEGEIQLREVKEKIVGMWYDALTKTEYFFDYTIQDEGFAEMLIIQNSKSFPIKFRYKVLLENENLFLELDGEKYNIITFTSKPPILSFKGQNNDMIVLYKGYRSLNKKKSVFSK